MSLVPCDSSGGRWRRIEAGDQRWETNESAGEYCFQRGTGRGVLDTGCSLSSGEMGTTALICVVDSTIAIGWRSYSATINNEEVKSQKEDGRGGRPKFPACGGL